MKTSAVSLIKRLALAAVALLLAGCAATQLDANVNTTGNWPSGRAPGSFAFERLPSQQAQAQQQDRLEADTLPALEKAGFVPVANGETPDVRVQVAARTTEGQIVYPGSAYAGPWGGGWGGARFGSPGWGWGWGWGYGPGWGWGAPAYSYSVFEIAILILDARTQQSLYETRAQSEGSGFDDGAWAALAAAALKDFPFPAVSPRRVTVELPK